ncbi:MAG: NAD(P)H-dependent oxidoreductase [Alphaproteobacteria bacterium]|jgi:chromate reductase
MDIFLMAASLRKDSVNKKLTDLCQKILSADHQIDYANMTEFDVPLYNMDIQNSSGIPATVNDFVKRITQAQKIIISSPEYNFSMSGVLKNLIDWVSRVQPMPWKGVEILLMSASPSMVGGNRGLWNTRIPLEACGSFVYPEMFSLADAYKAFDQDGSLADKKLQSRLGQLLNDFINKGK